LSSSQLGFWQLGAAALGELPPAIVGTVESAQSQSVSGVATQAFAATVDSEQSQSTTASQSDVVVGTVDSAQGAQSSDSRGGVSAGEYLRSSTLLFATSPERRPATIRGRVTSAQGAQTTEAVAHTNVIPLRNRRKAMIAAALLLRAA
jgi:hypothetical protein